MSKTKINFKKEEAKLEKCPDYLASFTEKHYGHVGVLKFIAYIDNYTRLRIINRQPELVRNYDAFADYMKKWHDISNDEPHKILKNERREWMYQDEFYTTIKNYKDVIDWLTSSNKGTIIYEYVVNNVSKKDLAKKYNISTARLSALLNSAIDTVNILNVEGCRTLAEYVYYKSAMTFYNEQQREYFKRFLKQLSYNLHFSSVRFNYFTIETLQNMRNIGPKVAQCIAGEILPELFNKDESNSYNDCVFCGKKPLTYNDICICTKCNIKIPKDKWNILMK